MAGEDRVGAEFKLACETASRGAVRDRKEHLISTFLLAAGESTGFSEAAISKNGGTLQALPTRISLSWAITSAASRYLARCQLREWSA